MITTSILLKSGLPWGASGASLNNFVEIGIARGTFVDSIARQKHHSALYIYIYIYIHIYIYIYIFY